MVVRCHHQHITERIVTINLADILLIILTSGCQLQQIQSHGYNLTSKKFYIESVLIKFNLINNYRLTEVDVYFVNDNDGLIWHSSNL
jgi:hypothetical protein